VIPVAARVATIEHLMAAFAATGITNAVVELDGPELPILDGSAAGFVFLIDCAGIATQDTARPAIAVQRTVRVEGPDGAFAELRPPVPGIAGLEADISIDFTAAAIGAQALVLHVTAGAVRRELAAARTFCLLAEVEAMQQAGLARGGSLDNAVVVDGERILNPAGLRVEGEFVRHKLLDAVGDLALAGAVLHGVLRAHRPGHGLNNRLLRAML
jgi:UDP-3-O-[3-hydroxymyristoyl] N-acetylglucosamine deacetylase